MKTDYLVPEEDEEKEAQEEAHKHFVSLEFSHLVLTEGPTVALELLSNEARTELSQSIINNYHKRLVEANSGL